MSIFPSIFAKSVRYDSANNAYKITLRCTRAQNGWGTTVLGSGNSNSSYLPNAAGLGVGGPGINATASGQILSFINGFPVIAYNGMGDRPAGRIVSFGTDPYSMISQVVGVDWGCYTEDCAAPAYNIFLTRTAGGGTEGPASLLTPPGAWWQPEWVPNPDVPDRDRPDLPQNALLASLSYVKQIVPRGQSGALIVSNFRIRVLDAGQLATAYRSWSNTGANGEYVYTDSGAIVSDSPWGILALGRGSSANEERLYIIYEGSEIYKTDELQYIWSGPRITNGYEVRGITAICRGLYPNKGQGIFYAYDGKIYFKNQEEEIVVAGGGTTFNPSSLGVATDINPSPSLDPAAVKIPYLRRLVQDELGRLWFASENSSGIYYIDIDNRIKAAIYAQQLYAGARDTGDFAINGDGSQLFYKNGVFSTTFHTNTEVPWLRVSGVNLDGPSPGLYSITSRVTPNTVAGGSLYTDETLSQALPLVTVFDPYPVQKDFSFVFKPTSSWSGTTSFTFRLRDLTSTERETIIILNEGEEYDIIELDGDCKKISISNQGNFDFFGKTFLY